MVENVEIKIYNVEKSVEKVKNSAKIGCKIVEKKFCNNVDKLWRTEIYKVYICRFDKIYKFIKLR